MKKQLLQLRKYYFETKEYFSVGFDSPQVKF